MSARSADCTVVEHFSAYREGDIVTLQGHEGGWTSLASSLRSMKHLTSLVVGCDGEFDSLSSFLVNNNSLHSLVIRDDRLSRASLFALSSVLSRGLCPSLRRLEVDLPPRCPAAAELPFVLPLAFCQLEMLRVYTLPTH